jgi:hypothetical protein
MVNIIFSYAIIYFQYYLYLKDEKGVYNKYLPGSFTALRVNSRIIIIYFFFVLEPSQGHAVPDASTSILTSPWSQSTITEPDPLQHVTHIS